MLKNIKLKEIICFINLMLVIGIGMCSCFGNKEQFFKNIEITNKNVSKQYIPLSQINKQFEINATRSLKGFTGYIYKYKNISFLRESKNYYYAVFESDNCNFYIFCDKQGVIESTFLLNKDSNFKIDSLKIGASLKDVNKADNCTILTKNDFKTYISQHVLKNGDQYYFSYEKNSTGLFVNQVTKNEAICKKYVSEIINYDLLK